MSVAKLGGFRFAAAAINATQIINIAALLESLPDTAVGMYHAINPTALDREILEESGVYGNVGLASEAGGYGNRPKGKFGAARTAAGTVWKNLRAAMDASMFFFNWAEIGLRRTAVLGAYYQAVEKKGMKPQAGEKISQAAIQYAKQINAEANFDYSVADTPNVLRRAGIPGQLLFQFKKYPIKQLELWGDVLFKRSGNYKQKVMLTVPYLLLAGVGGIPLTDVGFSLAQFVLGIIWGEPPEPEDLKRILMDWAGKDEDKKKIAFIAMYGLGSLVGVDISKNVGMGDAVTGLLPDGWAGLAGPLGSTIKEMHYQMTQRNPAETVKGFSPGLGNMLQAFSGKVMTARGRMAVNLTPEDRFVKALGFRTINEAWQLDYQRMETRKKKLHTNARQRAMDNYIEAQNEGVRGEELSKLAKELIRLKITPKQLAAERAKKKQDRIGRTIGAAPKKDREYLKGLAGR
jgi:hypothetical protein